MKKILLITALFISALSVSAQKWAQQNTGFTQQFRGIQDISIVNANVAYACAIDGSGGGARVRQITYTLNGGETWTPRTVAGAGINATLEIANVSAVNDSVAYVSLYNTGATASGVFRTINYGVTWTRQSTATFTPGTGGFCNWVHMFNANDGVTQGDPNNSYFEIYTTNNGGTTWVRVPQANIPAPLANEFGIIDYFTASGNNVWFSTSESRIYRSFDKGLTWAVSATGFPLATSSLSAMAFKDANNGIVSATVAATGVNLGYITTSDGGATWSAPNTAITGGLSSKLDISFVPGTAGTYVAVSALQSNPGSAITTDDGATWTNIDVEQYTSVKFLNQSVGYAGGFNTSATVGGISKFVSEVTFQADMTALIAAGFKPATDSIKALIFAGNPIGGVDGVRMTPTATPGIYQVVRQVPIGVNVEWKFRAFGASNFGNSGFETGNNRTFISGNDTTIGPIVPQITIIAPTVTNVTFRADMTTLLAAGFSPTMDSIKALIFQGNPVGGTDGGRMTPTANPNIYQIIRQVPIGASVAWKFRAFGSSNFGNSGFEGGNDRTFTSGNDTTIGPIVPLINIIPPTGRNVTFLADMTALLTAGFSVPSDSIYARVFSGTISGGQLGVRMAPTANPNIFSVVRVIPPGNVAYKFFARGISTFSNSGFEGGSDRTFVLGAGAADTTVGGPNGLVPDITRTSGLNQNPAFAKSILLFPNPNNGLFTLSMNSEDRSDLQINVVNMLGQKVYTESRNSFTGNYNENIDLTNMAQGLYTIQIRLGDGTYSARVMVQ